MTIEEEVLLFLELEDIEEKEQRELDQVEYERKKKEREAWNETVEAARKSLWKYCQLKSPKHYTDDKPFLRKYIEILQAAYEGRIIKFYKEENPEWQIVASTEGLTDYIICKKIMTNLPPRHGKTRGLIDFCQWVLGNNQEERVILCSYNDETAGDFSKYTRDGIQEQRIIETGYVFSDIFPGVKIKHGSHSYYKWALEGQFFNYLGAGIGGSITGKGGSIQIIDDPIKNSEEALNELRLQTIWDWYTGTFLSRGDAEGGEPLEIINMTRWANGDLCGRILDTDEAPEWYIFKLEVYDKETDQMLCERVLSKKRYFSLKKKMVPEIFNANYHQETVDQQGRLYKTLKTYKDLPRDEKGYPLYEKIKNYTDTADEGDDYLCSIDYLVYQGCAYILDVLYTKEGMEITEPAMAKMLIKNHLWMPDGSEIEGTNVNIVKIESNNGGRGFSRNVKRIIWEEFERKDVIIRWFHQSKNKMARILSQSSNVQENVYFPVNWKDRWPEFYKSMTTFLKEGKKQTDDAEDAITGVVENLSNKIEFLT